VKKPSGCAADNDEYSPAVEPGLLCTGIEPATVENTNTLQVSEIMQFFELRSKFLHAAPLRPANGLSF
jgi:hypothetical protein